MLDVPYDALVQDTEAAVRHVLAHCSLAAETAWFNPERNAAPVATPSSAQVREAIHGRGLGQWRAYEWQLEPLRLALSAHTKPEPHRKMPPHGDGVLLAGYRDQRSW
ncbi:hypothetical protein [Rhodanobacter sp. DHB23]|uniref:hypothetical protein n=1 Tax=Rhodanobacter sp. DHB23 TaxID=2775923 RepID=UPI00177E9A57|nr:hypothetical protein [Rhodanobacter sp. DHB23]MBD8873252.1 hypothetical protein [Rhodanobacter sp. DHB23]